MMFSIYEPLLALMNDILPGGSYEWFSGGWYSAALTAVSAAAAFLVGMVLFSNVTKRVLDKHHSLGFLMVLGFMFGFLAAAVFIYLQKRSLGSFVGQLLKEDCLTPASAKTPLALGCNRSTLLRSEWKRRGAITRYVHCVEEEGASDESNQKMDFSNMHFYIPEDKRYTAEVRYERRGSKLRSLLLVMVATVALATVVCIFLPVLLRWADWLIGMTAP
jgi:hypothetical protein